MAKPKPDHRPKTTRVTVIVPVAVDVTNYEAKDDSNATKFRAEAFATARAMLPDGAVAGEVRVFDFGTPARKRFGKRAMAVKHHHETVYLDCSTPEQERGCYLSLLKEWLAEQLEPHNALDEPARVDPASLDLKPLEAIDARLGSRLAMDAADVAADSVREHDEWTAHQTALRLGQQYVAEENGEMARWLCTRKELRWFPEVTILEVGDPT